METIRFYERKGLIDQPSRPASGFRRYDDQDQSEDVVDLCAELVRVFTEAGLTQNAIEALAYIREQAKAGRLTTKKIAEARAFFAELSRNPLHRFAFPTDEEG